MSAPEPALDEFLVDAGLIQTGQATVWSPLTGGVSSDIWRADAGEQSWCVKRALAQLKVAAEWKAPVERNAFEWDYMQIASAIAPGHVPTPIAHDKVRGLFAMAWLAPDQHRLWKSELLAGRVDVGDAAAMGDLLGRIHGATAHDQTIPSRFATDASFHVLRIDAYLLATACAHPDLAPLIEPIAARTAQTKRVLVHGDVSPKNIMLGPNGPILLDAECAWFGDPAFDLAFCLNHLLIKRLLVKGAEAALAASFDALASAYLAHVDWEPVEAVEARAAALLPVLALARVDGKSPVEYLDEAQRGLLREVARLAIKAQPATLRDCMHSMFAG
ncbi:phosphotransferase family protein [Sphingorhabdus sp.]|uniref:phosphotransferase family protein n=1 Tax=Sphingorhabdus sp. TaxID=1902408 RepID=UPI0038FC65C1